MTYLEGTTAKDETSHVDDRSLLPPISLASLVFLPKMTNSAVCLAGERARQEVKVQQNSTVLEIIDRKRGDD